MFCLPRKFVSSQNTCVFCLFFCLCWRKVIQLCSCFCSFFKLNKRAKLCFLAFAFVSLTVLSHLLCHPIFPFFLLPFSLDDLFSSSDSSLQQEGGSHSSPPRLCLQLWECVCLCCSAGTAGTFWAVSQSCRWVSSASRGIA